MKAAFLLILLAGLDVVASIKPITNSGPSHANAADVETVALSSGGSFTTMRREPLGSAHVATGDHRQIVNKIVADLVNLVATRGDAAPTQSEVGEACKNARSLMAARRTSEDVAVLAQAAAPAPAAAPGISADTLAAEADPCKFVNDALANALDGHVIVDDTTGAVKIEVPATTTIGPDGEEIKQIEQALKIFVGCCGIVGFCMVFVFGITMYIVRHKHDGKLKDVRAAHKTAREGEQAEGKDDVLFSDDDDAIAESVQGEAAITATGTDDF